MRKILSVLALLFTTISFSQEMSYDEKSKLANEIFDTLIEKEIKKAFLEILALDDFAIDSSIAKHPNPNDFMARIDTQRAIEETWRLKWYKKQSWWEKAQTNASIGYYVRARIAGFGVNKLFYLPCQGSALNQLS